ncbi:hypothetical protein [Bacillus norwichensis]|uniref:Uncharacterized protein n=1 Tax=Bacillus norwichensis TaxID=2762217 RepID=A0ABR8VQ89_9BACI|nr:hypothetical protein [Bacillus norwichensis]MBD8006927.1 hypothetical protein [Bacillus norwichensis]
MEWKAFFITLMIVIVIILLQWPRLKVNPSKDKAAFMVLLVIGLAFSLFDLQRMKGPITLRESLFKPFIEYMLK